MHRHMKLGIVLLILGTLVICASCVPADAADDTGDSGRDQRAMAAAGPSLYDLPTTWVTQHGDTIGLTSLAGRVQVLAMVYTNCAVTCPIILADLKRIEAAVPVEQRGDVGFVLISLDPDRDTPERLAEWAAQTKLDPARWTLLNGSDDAVRELAATLGVRYQMQPDAEVAHTNQITVLDRTGAIAHQQIGLGEPAGITTNAMLTLLR